MTTTPTLFISHGTPLTIVTDDDYAADLRAEGRRLGKPSAVVVMSAHGMTPDGKVRITAADRPRLVYDFGGFPPELYRIQYPCPGSPATAAEIASRLAVLGLDVELAAEAGLDHGVWVPLGIMFPEADVPVVQLSMPFPSEPRRILAMGAALAPLRDAGVLLVGSGGAVHNLRRLDWHGEAKEPSPWAREFNEWLKSRVEAMAIEDLLRFDEEAPHVAIAHPSTDHLQPIFFAIGAARAGERPRTIVDEFQLGTLSMYSFAIGPGASHVPVPK